MTTGTGSISQTGSTTTINQSSQNLSINWQSFNLAANQTVHFIQPNATAVVLNRVTGQDPSQILGTLNANGQVFILNPNGVLFGASAQVNVAGLVAATQSLGDSSFLAGNYQFSGTPGSSASVVNQGTLNAAAGGYIALLAPQVTNAGSISARQGSVLLAAGDQVTVQLHNGSLLGYSIDQGAFNALVNNQQLIVADGGQVVLAAQAAPAADALAAAVVNNSGIVEARTLQNVGGVIRLLGDMHNGSVSVGGTLDASAPDGGNGGTIETSAAHVTVASDAHITTLAHSGANGSWLIDPVDFTVAASGGDMTGATLSNNLAGGNVTIQSSSGSSGSSGNININDSVSWSANTLSLVAQNNININTTMNGSGSASLALQYGQGAVAAGNTSTYNINAAVNLPAGIHFSTQLGSNGTSTSYTVITALGAPGSTTGTDLQGVSGAAAGNYALGANIDAAATASWNSGAGFTSLSNFSGIFDGLGHTISNLNISTSGNSTGLFGSTSLNSLVQNVGLVAASIGGGQYTGALVGLAYGNVANSYASGNVSGAYYTGGLVGFTTGNISNSYATASVASTGNYIGGLAGYSSASISNSYATGSVQGTSYVGGLAGFADSSGSISNSYATGSVQGTSYVGGLAGKTYGAVTADYASGPVGCSTTWAGGLVGYEYSGNISNSYATGSVAVTGIGGRYAGGLVGAAYGSISTSYASGNVSSPNYAGGLAGYNGSNIGNSYATGAVSASSYSGGLVGWNNGVVGTSYATGGATGTPSYGLAGLNTGSIANSVWNSALNTAGASGGTLTNVVGLSGADLQTQANYTSATTANGNVSLGWDFNTVWAMVNGQTNPLLRALTTPLVITVNSVSTTYDGQAYAGTPTVRYSITPNFSLLSGTLTFSGPGTGLGGTDINVGSYTINASGLTALPTNYLISYVSGTLTINPANLTVSTSNVGKTYDGGLSANGTPIAVLGTLFGSDFLSGGTYAFNDKNVGSGNKTVTVTNVTVNDGNGGANYTVNYVNNTTSTITPRALTVSATGTNKVYDGTLSDTVTLSDNRIGGDVLTVSDASASFANKNVGNGKTVSVSGISVSGPDAANYTVNTSATTTATITPATLNVTATGVNKVYDGTVSASVTFSDNALGSDVVAVSANSATFADKNVGTGKPVSVSGITITGPDAGNYTCNSTATTSANITPLALVINAMGDSKVYDGTVNATGTLTDNHIATDDVTVNDGSAVFADKNVGNGKTVDITGITLSGADAGNYSYSSSATASANISPKALVLSGITAASKNYDGSTAATVSTANLAVAGLVNGDAVTVSSTGQFTDPNPGTNKTVLLSSTLGGAEAYDYFASGQTSTTASIIYTGLPQAVQTAINNLGALPPGGTRNDPAPARPQPPQQPGLSSGAAVAFANISVVNGGILLPDNALAIEPGPEHP